MKKIILKVKGVLDLFDQRNKIILFFVIGFALLAFTNIKPNSVENPKSRFNIDSLIPKGHVLIPIQILNAEAISGAIGNYGVVDLYSTRQGQKATFLFSKIKIIKSPTDEGAFSVIVKESKAHLLSDGTNPFFAAVQNPKEKAEVVDSFRKAKSGIKIIYQN